MDIARGYGRPEDWDDLFGARAEELMAEGESPPEEWVEAQARDGTRVVMDGTIQLHEDDTLTTSDL